MFLKNGFSLLTLVGTGDVLPKSPESPLPGQCTTAAAKSAGCSPGPPSLENCSCREGSHEPGGGGANVPHPSVAWNPWPLMGGYQSPTPLPQRWDQLRGAMCALELPVGSHWNWCVTAFSFFVSFTPFPVLTPSYPWFFERFLSNISLWQVLLF